MDSGSETTKEVAKATNSVAKLGTVIATGLGEVTNSIFKLDVKKIKRIGEAERTELIKNAQAENQAAKMEILGRAENRFLAEQLDKQINLENTFVKTKELLEGKEVSSENVDRDWTMRFFDVAQNVSREEVQDILAKILASEITKPGSYSLRTIGTLRNMSKNEVELFMEMSTYFLKYGGTYFIPNYDDILDEYKIRYDDLITLSECGLLNLEPFLSLNWNNMDENTQVTIVSDELMILIKNNEAEKNNSLNMPIYSLTATGRELLSAIIKNKSNSDFVKKVALEGLRSKNTQVIVTLHKINSIDGSDSVINYQTADLLPSQKPNS